MSQAAESTVDRIRAIVCKNLAMLKPDFDDSTNLFAAGLDSMNSIAVILGLEAEFGIQFGLGEIQADNFRTVHQIAALIERLQGQDLSQ
jgi:acyl carrier protein